MAKFCRFPFFLVTLKFHKNIIAREIMKKICVIELYAEYFNNKEYLLHRLKENDFEISTFSFFSKQVVFFPSKIKLLFDELICFIKLLLKFRFFRNKKVLCQGGQLSFFFMNRLFGYLLGKEFHLYVYNFYLHALGEKRIVKQILKYFLNSKKITLIVQSPGEVEYYKNLSNKCSVIFTPYCQDVDNNTESFVLNPPQNYIFSGGYTNRDYPLIIECAKAFPNICFVLVVSHLNLNDFNETIPSNVILYKDTDKELFYSIMKGAWAVIVPLKDDVGASGQMLCLGAMGLSKPIIYTDVSSINYYFKADINCGIPYQISDLNSLIQSINTLIRYDEREIKNIGENAYNNYIEKYTRNKGLDRLVDILCDQS